MKIMSLMSLTFLIIHNSKFIILIMIATLIEPYATMSGTIVTSNDTYTRMYRGKCIVQHKPRFQSALQARLREQFGRDYGTARKKAPS